MSIHIIFFTLTESFIVEYVETTYTVVEGGGQVEVCANLTSPSIDILGETIRVRFITDLNATDIPPGARRAGEQLYMVVLIPLVLMNLRSNNGIVIWQFRMLGSCYL